MGFNVAPWCLQIDDICRYTVIEQDCIWENMLNCLKIEDPNFNKNIKLYIIFDDDDDIDLVIV